MKVLSKIIDGPLFLLAPVGVALLFASLGHGSAKGLISGTVKGPDGEPFKGAFVRARNRKTRITVIVLSDRQGKYRIQDLPAGEYDVRAARVEYKSDPRSAGVNPTQPVVLDFALQKALVRWADLTNHQGKVLLPDGPGKTVLFTRCMACHGLQTQIAALRLDEQGWRNSVALMRNPKGPAETRTTDEEAAAIVPYLTKVFGVDSEVPSPAEMPGYKEAMHREFSDEAMKLVYVEYDLPGQNPNSYEATPNPNKKGNVWFVESWSGDGIAELNPETGEIAEFKLPPQRRAILEAHSVVEAPDGIVWFAEQAQCQLNRFDPRTKKFTAYRPSSCKENLGEEKIPGPFEVRVDRLGNVWANAATLWRFDPRTEKFTEFPEGGNAYGIELDQREGNVWFAQEWEGKIGKVDIKTLKLTGWTPSATIKLASLNKDQPSEIGQNQVHPKSAGPRHITSDSRGMIWFDEWFAGQLGSFDPDTETFKEFPLPGPAPTPYGVAVDRDDFVWYSSFDNDTLGRLDPTTGTVVEYPLPCSGDEIREILRDSEGHMWFGTSFNGKVGYFVPPERLKTK
jgi:virginiamycin B lyase